MIFNKDRFKQLREMRGLTLEDVANKIGVSRPTVQRWEKKSNFQPRPDKIPLLADLLQCKQEDIVTFGDAPLWQGKSIWRDKMLEEREKFKASLPYVYGLPDPILEQFRAGLIGALIDSDLPPEDLQTALKIVKNFKLDDNKNE